FRVLTLRGFDGQRDQIGHGTGKILFVQGPASLASGVGGTEDAQHLSTHANWRFQQGGGAVLDKMKTVKLLSARIGGGILGIDGALFSQRGEVPGRKARQEFLAAVVFPAAAQEFVVATQSGTVIFEEPDAGALNLEHLSSGLGYLVQGFG